MDDLIVLSLIKSIDNINPGTWFKLQMIGEGSGAAQADDLIIRTVYPQIPPKVEYSLTERGHSLVKVLDQLCDWGIANRR